MLERGITDVSLVRLGRLADFYGIRLSELLLEEPMTARPHFLHPETGLRIDRGPGIVYRVLTEHSHSGAQVIHTRLAPGSELRDLLAHQGADYWWVIRGTVTLLHGERTYPISAGTGVWYKGMTPHALRNSGSVEAETVSLNMPAYF